MHFQLKQLRHFHFCPLSLSRPARPPPPFHCVNSSLKGFASLGVDFFILRKIQWRPGNQTSTRG